jgi:hypothetical protein
MSSPAVVCDSFSPATTFGVTQPHKALSGTQRADVVPRPCHPRAAAKRLRTMLTYSRHLGEVPRDAPTCGVRRPLMDALDFRPRTDVKSLVS